MKSDIQERTNELLQRWQLQLEKKGCTGFCADGLLYRGEEWEVQGEDGKTYYGRSEGNEEELWINAPKRILFLLKDTNSNPDQDNREFHPGKNGTLNCHYRNLAYWLFGLLSFDEDNDAPEFGQLDLWEDVYPVFDAKPFAIVNCKKESGGATLSNEVLWEHLSTYNDYIKEQIEILNPDIIVCCGGSSLIKNYVEKSVYPNIKKVNNWIYCDEKNNKVVIDSYHPSYWQIPGGSKTLYEGMMSACRDFLDKYP
jgi:hypothetical protein